MALFKKNKKEAFPERSDIPSLPELPPLPESSELSPRFAGNDLSSLPSFPGSSSGDRMSQEVVKEAVKEPFKIPERKMLPPSGLKEGKLTFEMAPIEAPSLPAPPVMPIRSYSPPITPRRDEPIFIRIDKFEEAVETFEIVKNKLSEIESSLKELKNIKDKEEKELDNWEAEIEKIKLKIDNVDKRVFNKLD
ncbi:MAG: hypothetical protein ABIE22_00880 [archaeon]